MQMSTPQDPSSTQEESFLEKSPTGSSSTADTVLPSTESTAAVIGLRVLVSVKEAGIIIGKNGSVIADIRDKTHVRAGVSQVIQGTPDRILTVTGVLDDTAHALNLIAESLLQNPLDESATFQYFPLKRLLPAGPEGTVTLRLLVPNAQMGTIIGKQGVRIKELQQNFSVKVVASKDFLHNSTERLVELQGTPAAIEDSMKVLARCLMEDWHSVTGTTFYTPSPRANNRRSSNGNAPESAKTVQFPSEMVGCLIGKAGSRIQEIRKVSGAQITIAPADGADGQRQFTLVGAPAAISKALGYLNQNMEKEQERRARLAEAEEEEG